MSQFDTDDEVAHSLIYRQAWVHSFARPYTAGGVVSGDKLYVLEAILKKNVSSDQPCSARSDDADAFLELGEGSGRHLNCCAGRVARPVDSDRLLYNGKFKLLGPRLDQLEYSLCSQMSAEHSMGVKRVISRMMRMFQLESALRYVMMGRGKCFPEQEAITDARFSRI